MRNESRTYRGSRVAGGLAVAAACALLLAPAAHAADLPFADIPGLTGTSFTLAASEGRISTPDGASIYMWGYAGGGAGMQYPGPTLIVNQGDSVDVTLWNYLPAGNATIEVRSSIVFPGLDAVAVAGDRTATGELTVEARPGGWVTYQFTASEPGTYLYHSGTDPDLQVEMGLVGAIIVRPTGFGPGPARTAYGTTDTAYDQELLYLMTEVDYDFHLAVEAQVLAGASPMDVPTLPSEPVYWFINGRAAPDTMEAAFSTELPSQPYNCLPLMHPGQKMLIRLVGAGKHRHPFHPHGNHVRVLARDGRLLESEVNQNLLVGTKEFAVTSVPGETVDAVFEWTGIGMGWDIYGPATGATAHSCEDNDNDGFDDGGANKWEWCEDHGKPIPVTLPEGLSLAFGGFWSGSPYLGQAGSLPPGEGGLNPWNGFTYPWHSHAEKELVNYDLFPGGMLTFAVIVPWGMAQ